jgi:hypothetical protein
MAFVLEWMQVIACKVAAPGQGTDLQSVSNALLGVLRNLHGAALLLGGRLRCAVGLGLGRHHKCGLVRGGEARRTPLRAAKIPDDSGAYATDARMLLGSMECAGVAVEQEKCTELSFLAY